MEDRLDDALATVGRILEIDPGSYSARFLLARIRTEQKRFAEAEAAAIELLKDFPKEPSLYALYARIMLQTFNVEKADRLAAEALRRDPRRQDAEMLRAKLEDVPTGDIDVMPVASRTENFSGADIDGLIDTAKDRVLSEILDSNTSRKLETADLLEALDEISPSTVDWLKTARNLVKFAGADSSYRAVEKYLRKARLT